MNTTIESYITHKELIQTPKTMNIDVIQPFNRIHLPSPWKITAIHYCQNKLYVGFNNGNLTIYPTKYAPNEANQKNINTKSLKHFKSFNDIKGLFSDNDQSQLFSLDQTFKNVAENNSAIESISVLPVMTDNSKTILAIEFMGTLKIYERIGKHLDLINSFDEAKSLTAYEYINYNNDDNNKLFIIGAKKKIFIYQIVQKSRNIINFNKIKEVVLKDKVKTLTLLNDQVLIGLTYDFLFMNLNENFHLESLPVDETSVHNFSHSVSFNYFGLSYSGPETRVIKLSENEALLIKATQVVKLEKSLERCTIKQLPTKFSSIPLFIAYLNPLYLFVVFNKKVEIVDIESGDIIQRFDHQISSNQIHSTVENGNIILGSGNDILQFKFIDYQNQIDQYLSIRGAVKSAPLKNIKDPKNDLRLIGLNKAIMLVSKLANSNPLFGNDDNEALRSKKKLLIIRGLYKTKAIVLFESYFKYHESLVDISSEWILSFEDILALFPDFLHGGLDLSKPNEERESDVVEPSSKHVSTNVIKRITLADIDNSRFNNYNTTDSGTEAEVMNESGQSISNISTTASISSPTIKQSSSFKSQKSQLDYKHSKSQNMRKFIKAVNNLIIYLTDQRRIHLGFANEKKIEWKGIEITPFDIYPHLDEVNWKSHINNISSIIDTTLFLCYFYTKPMLLGPLLRLPNNNCNVTIVQECLLGNLHKHNDQLQNFIQELLYFYFGRKLHCDALEMLYKLAHDPKKQDHDDEFDTFIGGSDLTIQYLQRLNNDNIELVFKYSHWVLVEAEKKSKDDFLNSGELLFMNDSYECESYNNFKVLDFFMSVIKSDELAIRYLEWLLFESDVLENRKSSVLKFHTRLCLLYLKQLKAVSNSKTEIVENVSYTKLYSILEKTNHYEPWTVLKNIPTGSDNFLRLTIFIYKRLGEHDKSIDVLYNQLDDLDSAMNYCADIYGQPNSQNIGEQLLHKLLDDLLMQYDENISKIEKLLIHQGSKMSILGVLTSLPNSFPVSKLSFFLTSNLRLNQELVHDSRIASQLYKVGLVKLQHKLLTTESEGYLLQNGKQLCEICSKKLGYSVLSVDKNNQIVHYGCYQRTKS